jgi:hypothetical protein
LNVISKNEAEKIADGQNANALDSTRSSEHKDGLRATTQSAVAISVPGKPGRYPGVSSLLPPPTPHLIAP